MAATDGSINLLQWECGIPGKEGGLWAEGTYKLMLTFSDSYPANSPKCVFTPPIPHPNIFPSGSVCLSILSYGWKPTISIKQVHAHSCVLDLTRDPGAP